MAHDESFSRPSDPYGWPTRPAYRPYVPDLAYREAALT